MSLFQLVSMWLLRAALIALAVEVGADLWTEGLDRYSQWQQASAYDQSAERLSAEVARAENNARQLGGGVSGSDASDFTVAPGAAREDAQAQIRLALQQRLTSLGAIAPEADVSARPQSSGYWALDVELTWREPADSAPAVLYALARAEPKLSVAALRLARTDSGAVETHADIRLIARVAPSTP